jgi:hypothetical protein
MNKLLFLFIIFVLPLVGQQTRGMKTIEQPTSEQRTALVIGNANYSYAPVLHSVNKEEQKKSIEKQNNKQEQELTLENAIKKVKEYQNKIANVTSDFETQKQKVLQREIDNKPRGEFETQDEYNTRLQNNKAKQERIATEYDSLKKQNTKIYDDQITTLIDRKYIVGKKDISVSLGKYNVEEGFFP